MKRLLIYLFLIFISQATYSQSFQNWNLVYQNAGSPIIDMLFVDSLKGFALDSNGVHFSQDGGASWQPIYSDSLSTRFVNLHHKKDSIYFFATARGSNNHYHYSAQIDSLQFQQGRLQTSIYFLFSAQWYNDSLWGIGFLPNSFFEGLYAYKNGGYRLVLPTVNDFSVVDDLYLCTIKSTQQDPFSPVNNILYHSSSGSSWDSLYLRNSPNFLSSYGVYYNGSDTLYYYSSAVTPSSQKEVYRTYNDGQSWQQVQSSPLYPSIYEFIDPSTIYAAHDGVFMRSVDGAATYQSDTVDHKTGSGMGSHQLYVKSMNEVFMFTDYGEIYKNVQTTELSETKLELLTIKIYPNPVGDLLQLINHNGFLEYTLFDLRGSAIKKGRLHNDQQNIQLNELNSGVYLIRFESDESSRVFKFIKE